MKTLITAKNLNGTELTFDAKDGRMIIKTKNSVLIYKLNRLLCSATETYDKDFNGLEIAQGMPIRVCNLTGDWQFEYSIPASWLTVKPPRKYTSEQLEKMRASAKRNFKKGE